PGVSVSKKIENSKERARLKSIVNLIKPVGVGVIIRTEAEGQSESDIQEDLEILLEKWNNIITSAESLTPPNLIYRDQDLLYRVIREACTDDVKEIIVDTPFALNRVQNILQNWHMAKGIQVTLYKGTEPLLVAMDIHKEIKAALNVKVNMPSGGYLFIQQTEALTVIDVNSGKFISSATQDETILKTNIEAVHEIARQLRLRNIGGMIIVDFIDMMSRADKLAMLEELEIALEPDKAKPQVGQLSDLGLVELTRHRQGQSLSEIFTKKCPHCQGSGYFMNEFNFATPTAEGEYRAKAAKIKMPTGNFKKNNKFNNKNNNQQPQQTEPVQEQPQKIVIETEPSA
ncbi:MAG: Rne/Rng family ribonuclease, partial [Candidatus Gastranaerophilales bacterium]|nr:Rne/Rng family ribonuclease [Candidatus Gastranaerophilales bacterium]